MLSFEQCFILFCSFPLLFAFVVGGLGFEFYVFVAGWRHALRSEWPFIIIIINVQRTMTMSVRHIPVLKIKSMLSANYSTVGSDDQRNHCKIIMLLLLL